MVSAWVSASAGSGKTKVLIDRILRLLLSGAKADSILCLTYTNTATAEMKNRINEKLLEWVFLSDEELSDKISKLTGQFPNKDTLNSTRRLFAYITDDAQALRIQTIHSFCQDILKKFPLESGIEPNFKIAEDTEIEKLINEARMRLFNDDTQHEEHDVVKAIEKIALQVNDETLTKLLKSALGEDRNKFSYMFSNFSLSDIIGYIYGKLSVLPTDNEELLMDLFVSDDCFNRRDLSSLCDIVEELGTATEQKLWSKTKTWIDSSAEDRKKKIHEHISCFLTDKGQARAKLLTKKPREAHAWADSVARAECDRILDFTQKLKGLKVAELTKSLVTIVHEILDIYAEIKRHRGLMDYNDLITKTYELLQKQDFRDWVRLKLDGSIDHILVDEAQDTSPYQWEIFNALREEFFVGEGSKEDINRTIFVVGDEKQSIYSFQGAVPQMFSEVYRDCQNDAGFDKLKAVPLNYSFRSLDAVLKVTDAVFSNPQYKNAIAKMEGVEIKHTPIRNAGTGRVEIWPLIPKVDETIKNNNGGWELDFENKQSHDNKTILAKIIAKKIKEWEKDKKWIYAKGREFKYQDVMILIRSRTGGIVDSLTRELQKEGIAVSSNDSIELNKHLVVKDLLGLIQFILLPSDNLNLACILKSPIFNFSENELMDVAMNRDKDSKETLWDYINRVIQNPDIAKNTFRFCKLDKLKETQNYLLELIEFSKTHKPFEVLEYVLEQKEGRAEIINRMGKHTNEIIDKFLQFTINFEINNTPTLQNFLHFTETTHVKIKSEADSKLNEVRIMTTHSAKGLQAPIVFLVETTKDPFSKADSGKILWKKHREDDEGDFLHIPFWSGVSENDTTSTKETKEKNKKAAYEEYLRLLYVAMTRAEDELYVCGWENKGNSKDKDKNSKKKSSNKSSEYPNWYDVTKAGILKLDNVKEHYVNLYTYVDSLELSEEQKEKFKGTAYVYESGDDNRITKEESKELISIYKNKEYNEQKTQDTSKIEFDEQFKEILNPSEYFKEKKKNQSPIDKNKSIIFGNIVHKLLEILPNIEKNLYTHFIDKYLENTVSENDNLTNLERQKIKEQVINILTSEDYQVFFGKNSKAEVPIVCETDDNTVSGIIDRLAFDEATKTIYIIDYKTSSYIPKKGYIPKQYRHQLNMYKQAIEKIYSDYSTRCGILWTINGEIEWLR